MNRAPFQVLILPFLRTREGILQYAVFKRTDDDAWQGIAGGGNQGETPFEAATRESFEEAGISYDSEYIALDSFVTIPVVNIRGFIWGDDVLVIPEYAFGVRLSGDKIHLSGEHTEYRWLSYEEASTYLRWDSNRSALWELNHRLRMSIHSR